MEMLVFKYIQNRFYFSKTKDFMYHRLIYEHMQTSSSKCDIPEKIKTTHFWICQTLGNSRESKTSSLDIPQSCVAPLGNSKAKNQDQWKFHMNFS